MIESKKFFPMIVGDVLSENSKKFQDLFLPVDYHQGKSLVLFRKAVFDNSLGNIQLYIYEGKVDVVLQMTHSEESKNVGVKTLLHSTKLGKK